MKRFSRARLFFFTRSGFFRHVLHRGRTPFFFFFSDVQLSVANVWQTYAYPYFMALA